MEEIVKKEFVEVWTTAWWRLVEIWNHPIAFTVGEITMALLVVIVVTLLLMVFFRVEAIIQLGGSYSKKRSEPQQTLASTHHHRDEYSSRAYYPFRDGTLTAGNDVPDSKL